MNVTVTFKVSPEDEGGRLTFPEEYTRFRTEMEAGAVSGLFGPFDKVEVRWLLANEDEENPTID
jgi:hypothetical protein